MYGRYGDGPDARIRRAWVTIHDRHTAGVGLGAGVAVADGYLLTCAHVINAVLQRDKLASAEPTSQEMRQVRVSFPGIGSGHHSVELVGWLPPRAEGRQWWDGDLALLKSEFPDPEVRPPAIRETSTHRLFTWYAHGAPRSLVDVVVQASMGPWYILDPGSAPLDIQPGHSGAPLWDREHGCVAGMVVSAEPDNRRSYAIRASEMLKMLATAGLMPAADARVADPRERARRHELIDALDGLSDKKLRRCARRFSRDLRLPWNPSTREELVDSAIELPRGIPALLATLTAYQDVRCRFQEAAAKLRPLRILTPDEYEELSALLGQDAYPELREGARRAVPHLALTDSGATDVAALIEDLEDRESEPGVVPPLIQVIEEVAAARLAHGQGLQGWSDRVVSHLELAQGALAQCRWSARSRASVGTSTPVLRVWLWPEPAADAFHCVIRLYDGRGNLMRTWADGDAPRSRSELCADLSEAVDDLDQYEDAAGVEFLLEEGSFGLEVDQLPTRAGTLGTRPVGLDRPVVLRGQHAPRLGPWRARWERRQHPTAGPYVASDQEATNRTLTIRRDIACVIACCPPDQQARTLALCRLLGVPVVLWHRDAHGPDAVDVLRPVVREDWQHSLREEVRRHRAEALNDPSHMGSHLALLWEDPSWTPTRPRLSNPTR